ncbi:MAG: hypothetical protein PHX43_00930 [Alphaproteobacteria bacterium]|nr:hypothetical protein [Alphaproteobacteria bacterium]
MIRASSIFFWFALTIVASIGLYNTSYRVHDLGQQLRKLNASIEAEQRTIHVLKAEWVYLANPARIEKMAKKYLAMNPSSLQQIANLKDLPEIAPTRAEAMANMTISGTPIASVKTSLSPSSSTTKTKPQRMASIEDGNHINTHMVMKRGSETAASSSNGQLNLANFGNEP